MADKDVTIKVDWALTDDMIERLHKAMAGWSISATTAAAALGKVSVSLASTGQLHQPSLPGFEPALRVIKTKRKPARAKAARPAKPALHHAVARRKMDLE